ncbi:MAG TPA: hypothetical protein VLG38_06145, partial [Gammaproteobacteria bacterium]|nr:hypothetical protein [Gammaproteobacteria bacterium]
MRMFVKTILASMLLLTSAYAYADSYDNPDSPNTPLQGVKYVYALGFDLDQQIMHPVNDFVNLTYPTRFGGEIYASYRMLGPLGFELGYHWTTDKGKNIVTVPGTVLFNTAATISTEYECKLRVEDTYLDAYWHYKIRKIAELKLGIGVGFVRENLRFYNPAGFTDPLGTALAAMTTNTTITARFNMGIQTMLTKRIGARALF